MPVSYTFIVHRCWNWSFIYLRKWFLPFRFVHIFSTCFSDSSVLSPRLLIAENIQTLLLLLLNAQTVKNVQTIEMRNGIEKYLGHIEFAWNNDRHPAATASWRCQNEENARTSGFWASVWCGTYLEIANATEKWNEEGLERWIESGIAAIGPPLIPFW